MFTVDSLSEKPPAVRSEPGLPQGRRPEPPAVRGRSRIARAAIALLIVFVPLSAAAASQTVQATRPTPLFDPGSPHRVARTVEAGTALEVLGFDPDSGFYRVALPAGTGERFFATSRSLGLKPRPDNLAPGTTTARKAWGRREAAYSIYLPTSYDRSAEPPLIFAFSPVGNASRIVQTLRPAAEKRGWIVVGCHGPRDGRDEGFYPTVREILLDVRRRFPHDRKREYLAGFSGGAMASYRLSRVYWDEFSGIIAFGGWLGIYDQDLIYPQRLAVALINGRQDQGANQYQKNDRRILSSHGIRSKVFRFDGGHQYPGSRTIEKVLDWLQDDWRKRGSGMLKADARAPALFRLAADACRAKQIEACAKLNFEYLIRYPYREETLQSAAWLSDLFSGHPPKTPLAFLPPQPIGSSAATVFFGMFQGVSEIDPGLALAFLETAHRLDPSQAETTARLAHFLLTSNDPRIVDRERAMSLAVLATEADAKNWMAWFVKGLAESDLGRTARARASIERAYKLAPNWAQLMCRQILRDLDGTEE